MANCFFGLGAGLGGPLGKCLGLTLVDIYLKRNSISTGGFLSSNIGWRWAFIIQIPILIISAILVWLKVHIPLKNTGETPRQKLAKVDFLGSITLVSAVSCLLVGMTLKTSADTELPWSDPKVWVLLLLSGIFAIAFILVEKFVAKAPLMPMRLVTYASGRPEIHTIGTHTVLAVNERLPRSLLAIFWSRHRPSVQ